MSLQIESRETCHPLVLRRLPDDKQPLADLGLGLGLGSAPGLKASFS